MRSVRVYSSTVKLMVRFWDAVKVVILLFCQHSTKRCQPANEPLVRHAAESLTLYKGLHSSLSASGFWFWVSTDEILLPRLTRSGLAWIHPDLNFDLTKTTSLHLSSYRPISSRKRQPCRTQCYRYSACVAIHPKQRSRTCTLIKRLEHWPGNYPDLLLGLTAGAPVDLSFSRSSSFSYP